MYQKGAQWCLKELALICEEVFLLPPDPHPWTVVVCEVGEWCLDLEHQLSDEDWPCDVLIGQLKVFCQLGIVDKLPLKKPPASAVEDVSPSREKTIKRVAHLSDYEST